MFGGKADQHSVATTPPAATAPAAPASGPCRACSFRRNNAGPLQDTLIQRLRDPVDGTICYLYLPIVVHHEPVDALGYVEYKANSIGSIACYPPAQAVTRAAAPAATPARRAVAPAQ